MTDKNVTKLITRLLVAAYILYLGFMILTSSGESDQKIVFIIIGIFFLVADIGFIVYSIYTYIKNKKSDDNK
jgi:high-affinity Fe2+/Pb2+ permease